MSLEKDLTSNDDILGDFEVKLSDGLWKQLNDANRVQYTSFTVEDMHKNLLNLIQGPLITEVNNMHKKCIIDEEQQKTLTAMITSPDYESRELAEDLIKVINKDHGNTIRSRRT